MGFQGLLIALDEEDNWKMTNNYDGITLHFQFDGEKTTYARALAGLNQMVKEGKNAWLTEMDRKVSFNKKLQKDVTAVTLNVSSSKPSAGTAVKSNISPSDLAAYLGFIKGDKTAVRQRTTNLHRSMTDEHLHDAYEAVVEQLKLAFGGNAVEGSEARARKAVMDFIRNDIGVHAAVVFDSDVLMLIAGKQLGIAKSKVTIDQRIRALAGMKAESREYIDAVDALGFPRALFAQSREFYYAVVRRKTGMTHTLRHYKDGLPADATMHANGTVSVPVRAQAAARSGAVINGRGKAVEADDVDKAFERAKAFLKSINWDMDGKSRNKILKEAKKLRTKFPEKDPGYQAARAKLIAEGINADKFSPATVKKIAKSL